MKLRKPFRILRNLILFFFISSIGAVIFYRFVPVYVTPLMIIRSVLQLVSGEKVVCKHTWVPFDKISQRIRHDRNQKSDEGKRNPEKETGCQYHQPADSEKRLSLATIFVDTKRI